MATPHVSALPGTRVGGLALIAGVILSLAASLFFPGGALIDTVDAGDFAATITTMANNASLTHVTTLGVTFALLLEAYGVLTLLGLTSRQGGLADAALRFGVITSILGWGLFIIESGTRHMAVHVTLHGVGGGTGPNVQPQLDELALTVYTAGAAVHFAFLAVSSVAAIFLGIGLASRFSTMNLFKAATYGMVLVGVLGLVNLIIIQHIHDIELSVVALVSNGALTVGAVCFLVFGIGMYKGRSELSSD